MKEKCICNVYKSCGGCSYQGNEYEKQLLDKEKLVKKLIEPFCKVNGITGMEAPFHYRNKVHAAFGRTRQGEIICGPYSENTHRIVPVKSCLIEDQAADDIIQEIKSLLKSFKIKVYDEDSGYGLLRHVLVKRAFATGEVMVVLVLSSPILPSKNNFVKALRKNHPEITTVIINVNDKKTSMVLGDKESVIFGKGYIEDMLCGRRFRISSKSFYQVNPVQTKNLYSKAIELAGLTGEEDVIDAYCGIGTIGLIAADKAKKVLAVELNKEAYRDAIANSKINGIKNVQFYNQDAGIFMQQLTQYGETVDTVFMDPPRAGSDEKFINSVAVLKPKKVVYISCNPETLARDLKLFKKKGYRAEEAWPFDMFPFTGHVETVCLLVLRNHVTHINIDVDVEC